MSITNLSRLNNSDLVERFRALAIEKSKVLLDSNTAAANRIYDRMEEIDQELRRRGSDARKALLVLLDDRDRRVRFEAAQKSLAVAPQKALETIKQIAASHFMPLAGEAGMALEFLADGIFKPD